MIELVIFDCDGVLIDSERLAVRVDAVVLAALGWPMGEEEIVDRFVGRSHASMTADIEAHLGRRLPPDWDAEFRPLYEEAFERELAPVEGIVAALDAIDLPTCVASSSGHARLRRTLGMTGLHERFAGRIFSAEDVARGKPEPDLFLHAAARLGVDPGACVVVEDSPFGLAAARAAGMRSFGYHGGLSRPERLRGPGTVLLDDMRELPRLLDRMRAAAPGPWAEDAAGDAAEAAGEPVPTA
ncbi:HAD family hydrolase [Kitasatospora sp. NBC_01287]|uniref:HAD family hydrolase n=1 Tax=Kitasatospora sp. NBC_01287 TaxID=2903573 RepID=UPI00225A618D|nr:HAD family hydrolase [Kitasatospora sp. NBC_01287]MCX4744116.1 HAD family hydrolase [Kitasatospora sp. NBC_01287]